MQDVFCVTCIFPLNLVSTGLKCFRLLFVSLFVLRVRMGAMFTLHAMQGSVLLYLTVFAVGLLL